MEIVSLVVGVITIIWFIIDTKKENSKVLKAILDVQETSVRVQQASLEALKTIEEGQKSGFETLGKIQQTGFETMGKMLLQQTKILARIGNK